MEMRLYLRPCSCFVHQTALKGEDDPQPSKKNPPGKKRKNIKKNQSRKRTNAPPEKEVCISKYKPYSEINSDELMDK